jgi:hypothetical protein
MTTISRWFFKSPQSTETFIFEGNPQDIPAFQGWIRTKKRSGAKKIKSNNGKFIYKEPSVLYKGFLYYGRLLSATYSDGAPCSPRCRRATGHICRCSCGGKNHGIENRDMAGAIQEEDVIWIGD